MRPLATQAWRLLRSSLLSLLIFCSPGPAGAAVDSATVTVYYFHGNYRCETCLFVEGVVETTLRAEFPDELTVGKVVWRPLNMQRAENRHFITQFGLKANELVVVHEKRGERPIWEKIPQVWELSSHPERLSSDLRDAVLRLLKL